MQSIISVNQAKSLSNRLHREGKSIVLAGGCFDILHLGHIRYLAKAKQLGDVLIVMLESDERIRLDKGPNRPIHSQKERAEILSQLKAVDHVLLLPLLKNTEYDLLVKNLKPAIIAATKGDRAMEHKIRQSKLTGAKLKYVNDHIAGKSTSQIYETLQQKPRT